MLSYLWCFAFLICVLTQTNKINAQEIKEEDRSRIGNLFRFGADLKLKAADELDDLLGQFRGFLGAGGGSLLANLRQIAETASTGIQNGDTAIKNSLEAAKNAALTSYLAGRAAPKAAVDLTNVGMKTLENLIKNPISPRAVSGKQVKQVVVVYEDGSVEPVSDPSDNNLFSLFAAAH